MNEFPSGSRASQRATPLVSGALDLYPLVRPLLFTLPPETAHGLVLAGLDRLQGLTFGGPGRDRPEAMRTVMGLRFPNVVGLAAGLDKNGEHIDALASLGFGFIEIGTVTARPEAGNPKPRLFRLPEGEALINRMGFNNAGVETVIRNVEKSSYRGVLGISIGRNAATPADRAGDDYIACLEAVYRHASYVAINISSPNTAGLRTLQAADELNTLLTQLGARREQLAVTHGHRVPLVVKIAPDLGSSELSALAAVLRAHKVDGVIATNTTLDHAGVLPLRHGSEKGGLSGAPLRARALAVVTELSEVLSGAVPIIGSGGISSVTDGMRMLDAGASLLQIYTGLVYRGPRLVSDLRTL